VDPRARLLIAGIVIWGTTAGMMVPEPRTFDKGLVIVKVTDILLSRDKWTIVVNIALDNYNALIYIMKRMIHQIHQEMKVHKNPKSYFFLYPLG